MMQHVRDPESARASCLAAVLHKGENKTCGKKEAAMHVVHGSRLKFEIHAAAGVTGSRRLASANDYQVDGHGYAGH